MIILFINSGRPSKVNNTNHNHCLNYYIWSFEIQLQI